MQITAWHGLHPRLGRRGLWATFDQPPIVAGTVIRLEVQHLPKIPRPGPRRPCGCGPPAPDSTSKSPRGPTRAASTSSTPSGSSRTPSVGPRPRYAPRTSRRLDVADPRRLHPAAPGLQPRAGRAPALGTTTQTRATDPRLRPQRISSTCPNTGHPSQSTKKPQPRPRRPKGTRPERRTRYPAIKKPHSQGLIASSGGALLGRHDPHPDT